MWIKRTYDWNCMWFILKELSRSEWVMDVSESKAFKRAKSNLNKLTTAFLKHYPHHVMPGYNLNTSPCIHKWNVEDAMGLYQEFPYNCDLPRPLLPPAKLSRTGNCNTLRRIKICVGVSFFLTFWIYFKSIVFSKTS